MPYNTRNPVGPNGSNDPRDLFDNSGIVDVWATDRGKMSHPDRMGVPRKTWAGMEQAFDVAQIERQSQFDCAEAERDTRFLSAQGDRAERFESLMLSTAYQPLGAYGAGITFTERNQYLEKDGAYFRPAPQTDIPFTTTGNWAEDSAKLTPMGDDVLRNDLASSSDPLRGASLVRTLSPLAGAISRAVSTMLLDWVNVKDYGAIGDGQSHPLGEFYTSLSSAQLHYSNITITSLTQEVDWAATQCAFQHAKVSGKYVFGPAGTYVSKDTIIQPQYVKYIGEGPLENPSTPQDPNRFFKLVGTNYIFKGVGPKVHVANLAACDGSSDGDLRTNTSSVEPGYDTTYRKTSFWNHDANPITGAAATQKLFSCGWKIEQGGFSQLRGVGLIPYHDGVNGYNDSLATWADDWDIGLWIDNHHDLLCESVSVVGYWRMAGVFGSTSLPGRDTRSPDWERNKFQHCHFQGFSSFLVRGSDLYDIKAVGADWIEIDWFDSHPFDPAFDDTFRTQEYGGLFCSYTGTQKVGAYLRITGVSPSPAAIDPSNTANRVILGRRTNGAADAAWDNCYFYGMNHRAYRATSAAFGESRYTTPSRCIEISGASIRGLKFNDSCKVMTCDDIGLYLGNVLQFEYNGSFESKDVEGRGTGLRNVAGINSYQIRLGQKVRASTGVDMRPAYPTVDSRFTAPGDIGMFSPSQVIWDGWTYGVTGHVDIRAGVGQRVGFMDASGVPVLYRSATGEYRLLDVSGATVSRFNPSTDTWTHQSDNYVVSSRSGKSRFRSGASDSSVSGQVVRIYNDDSTVVMGRFDSTSSLIDFAGNLRPDVDNNRSVGSPERRFTTVYATNTTISSSDGRLKTPVRKLSCAEAAAGIDLANEFGIWQWLERVDSEGDDARLHCGMTVQRAIEIMRAYDLDPMSYSFICYDSWGDEWEDRPAILKEDGQGRQVEVVPAQRILLNRAGDLYSFRMNELKAFIIAALIADRANIVSMIEDLKERVNSIAR